jgi:hypothetical protein
LVYQVSDSTEGIISRTIEGIQKLLNPQYGNTTPNTTPEEEAAGVAIIMNNPATEKHFELQIKTLQEAPRDPDKLREILEIKQRQYEKAKLAEGTHPLVTEIEMHRFALCTLHSAITEKK